MLVCASLLMCGCVESYEYEAASLSGEGNAFIVGNAVTTLGFKPFSAPIVAKQALCIFQQQAKSLRCPKE